MYDKNDDRRVMTMTMMNFVEDTVSIHIDYLTAAINVFYPLFVHIMEGFAQALVQLLFTIRNFLKKNPDTKLVRTLLHRGLDENFPTTQSIEEYEIFLYNKDALLRTKAPNKDQLTANMDNAILTVVYSNTHFS
uniref:Uncharacterized protein n=1 Tax=Glossina austeni TaxID=7395 RepID=A0A1A9USJ6_GLOAU